MFRTHERRPVIIYPGWTDSVGRHKRNKQEIRNISASYRAQIWPRWGNCITRNERVCVRCIFCDTRHNAEKWRVYRRRRRECKWWPCRNFNFVSSSILRNWINSLIIILLFLFNIFIIYLILFLLFIYSQTWNKYSVINSSAGSLFKCKHIIFQYVGLHCVYFIFILCIWNNIKLIH